MATPLTCARSSELRIPGRYSDGGTAPSAIVPFNHYVRSHAWLEPFQLVPQSDHLADDDDRRRLYGTLAHDARESAPGEHQFHIRKR